MGLDRPLPTRFVRFAVQRDHRRFRHALFHRRPVAAVIAGAVAGHHRTELAALLLALLVAIPLGVVAAVHRGGLLDRLATVGSLFGVSLPGFWFGILLLIAVRGATCAGCRCPGAIDFADSRRTSPDSSSSTACSRCGSTVLPTRSRHLAAARGHARPADGGDPDARHPRLDARGAAPGLHRLRRGQGSGAPRILALHALKNALLPTVTVAAIETGSLLGGNMVVETVFGWPGLGRLVVESIFVRNYPLVQAAVLLYAVTYVLVNFAGRSALHGAQSARADVMRAARVRPRWPGCAGAVSRALTRGRRLSS